MQIFPALKIIKRKKFFKEFFAEKSVTGTFLASSAELLWIPAVRHRCAADLGFARM
jgi:hypothetical protein